jgi:hypothetical protein
MKQMKRRNRTMPCWEVREIQVDMSKADQELLREIIAELGLEMDTILIDGVLQATSEEVIKKVKRAYAAKVIRKVAKKKGWRVDQKKQQLYIRR